MDLLFQCAHWCLRNSSDGFRMAKASIPPSRKDSMARTRRDRVPLVYRSSGTTNIRAAGSRRRSLFMVFCNHRRYSNPVRAGCSDPVFLDMVSLQWEATLCAFVSCQSHGSQSPWRERHVSCCLSTFSLDTDPIMQSFDIGRLCPFYSPD